MKIKHLILAILIGSLFVASCKNNDKSKFPDARNRVTQFAPIGSFKSMFLALDGLGKTQESFSIGMIAPSAQDTLHNAFAWGVLTTDLQLAVLNRNGRQLDALLAQIIGLGPKLGLEDISAKLRDSVKPMLDSEDWPILENTLYNMQYSVEQTLFDKERYEMYTVMSLGSWTEATNQFARRMGDARNADSSRLLLHPETWQSLLDNFRLISDKQYTASPAFQTALKELKSLVKLMEKPPEEFLTGEEIGSIISSTSAIKAAFVKAKP
ncbi:MAG: hypothetical protein K0B87_01435 [Candidatus Syntrophosphaera sp.]|nr:hypothetical protein [Candidatus Syntrophosphaera sp.]